MSKTTVQQYQAFWPEGKKGETYAIGGNNEHSNIALCDAILTLLDKIHPKGNGTSYRAQIKFVSDRPGHDYRYAIDPTKIQNELGWKPKFLLKMR